MENVQSRRGEESPDVITPVRKYPSLSQLDLNTFLAGCDDALNPQVCLTQVADNMAMGEPLIGTVNSLSLALCPIATEADEFAPDQCFTEVLGGVGSILNLTGGLGELCPEGADPFTCLLAAGENLGPIGELLGESRRGGAPPGGGAPPHPRPRLRGAVSAAVTGASRGGKARQGPNLRGQGYMICQ